MENDIINEHKEYLSNRYGIKLNSKIETLSLLHWIPKVHKTHLDQESLQLHQNVH